MLILWLQHSSQEIVSGAWDKGTRGRKPLRSSQLTLPKRNWKSTMSCHKFFQIYGINEKSQTL